MFCGKHPEVALTPYHSDRRNGSYCHACLSAAMLNRDSTRLHSQSWDDYLGEHPEKRERIPSTFMDGDVFAAYLGDINHPGIVGMRRHSKHGTWRRLATGSSATG